jgi:hypothetical protein
MIDGNAAEIRGRLRISVGTLDLISSRESNAAPKTCELFRRILPLRAKLIHCSWSGEGVWVPLGYWAAPWHTENETGHPKPGQLLLYAKGVSEPELLIPCGICIFNSKFGTLGNHFATVVAGVDRLSELHWLALRHGAQDCTIENVR